MTREEQPHYGRVKEMLFFAPLIEDKKLNMNTMALRFTVSRNGVPQQLNCFCYMVHVCGFVLPFVVPSCADASL